MISFVITAQVILVQIIFTGNAVAGGLLTRSSCDTLVCDEGSGLAELCCPTQCPLRFLSRSSKPAILTSPGVLCSVQSNHTHKRALASPNDRLQRPVKTNEMFVIPSLFIIGSGKAGTSTIFLNLLSSSNRRIQPARRLFPRDGDVDYHRKELSFFGTDRFTKGMAWYSSHFSRCNGVSRDAQIISIDASPGMVHSPSAPLQLRSSYAPTTHEHLRFIVLLRNPVDRLASWHGFLVRLQGSPQQFQSPHLALLRKSAAGDCDAQWGLLGDSNAPRRGGSGGAEAWTSRCGQWFSCLGADEWANALLSNETRAARYFDSDERGLARWLRVFVASQFMITSFEEIQPDGGAALTHQILSWLFGQHFDDHAIRQQQQHQSNKRPSSSPPSSRTAGSVVNAGVGDSSKRSQVFSTDIRRQLNEAAIRGLSRLCDLLAVQNLGSKETRHSVASWLTAARLQKQASK